MPSPLVFMTWVLLLIAALESFATTCTERGVYFYCHDRLRFSDVNNLWLALSFGTAYTIGALGSHGLCRRFKERPVLVFTISAQVVCHFILAAVAVAAWAQWDVGNLPIAFMYGTFACIGFLNGAKWPVLESYISAGRLPREQAKAVGRFNVAWSMAVPLALMATGPMIGAWSPMLFLVPLAINLVCIAMSLTLAKQPAHLPDDHQERPSGLHMERLSALLVANRWLMIASYSTMFLLAPLLPRILESVGASAVVAPALSGLLDIFRMLVFFTLGMTAAWHGRVRTVAVSLIMLPTGFFMVLFGQSLWMVLAGELLFGTAAGTVYYAALYYAMVVKNAAVEGGGAHEGLIGGGFAIGPAIGLLSVAVAPLLGSKFAADVTCTAPFLLACSCAAILPLLRAARTKRSGMQ